MCKAWYGPATNVLYEIVDLSRVSSVFKFHQSLVERPHLRSIVKTLALPGRVWRSCPQRLLRVFLQIIDLVESLVGLFGICQVLPLASLSTVSLTGNRVVLPIAPNKHKDLRCIDLYADSMSRCIFPGLLALSFEKLEWLSFYGFCIQEDVSPLVTPPLPNLIAVSCIYGDIIKYLDAWLQTCPKLTTLLLRETILQVPADGALPLGLLKKPGLIQLKLNSIHMISTSLGGASLDWLGQCDTIPYLELDWGTFDGLNVSLPTSMTSLTLRVEYGKPNLPAISPFLDKNPTVKQFEWRVCRHDKWFIANRPKLEDMMKECGVTMTVDHIPCFCLRECYELLARKC